MAGYTLDRRYTGLITASFLAAAFSAGSAVYAGVETIAISGQAAPDFGGTDGVFVDFQAPVLNDAGQLGFKASGMTGTTFGTANDFGVFRGSATPGSLIPIVRERQAAPVSNFGSPGPFNGVFSQSIGDLSMNDLGLIGFRDSSLDFTSPTSISGIFTSDGVTHRSQLRSGDNSFSQTVTSLGTPSLSLGGLVGFTIDRDGVSSNDSIVGRRSSGSLTALAIEGSSAPSGGVYGHFSTGELVSINSAGQVAVKNSPTGTSNSPAIFRLASSSGGGSVVIAHKNTTVPGGNGSFSSFSTPLINDLGVVAFEANLAGTSGGSSDDDGIYRGSGSFLSQIARAGNTAPGGDGFLSSIGRPVAMNISNQVVFQASLTGTSRGSLNDTGLYRGSGGTPTEIVREGDVAVDGNGEFNSFLSLTAMSLNDTGQVAFETTLRGTAGGAADDRGVFLGDGQEVIRVVREGQALAGSTVVGVDAYGGVDTGGRSFLNDAGQVGFWARLANGDEGVFLFTPELHWRRTSSSSWDTSSNWTVGLRPGVPHDVMIDPAASVVVNGPSSDTQVKSLRIGGGTGVAALDLQAGAVLTSGDGLVEVQATGVLTGDGTIDAAVMNLGTLTADNLTVRGLVQSSGLVNGSGRINAGIVNGKAGTIQALSGDHLHLTASISHTNQGLVDVNGQDSFVTLEIDSGLLNMSSGRIQVRGRAGLQMDGGLLNDGILSLGFADATVSGDLTNSGSIGIAFSNTTFASGDLVNEGFIAITDNSSVLFADDVVDDGGAMFISEGSTAVFFGSYNGSTSGTGHVTILGDLAPGSSPGVSRFGGDLSIPGVGTLEMELAGTVAGSGYDQLIVEGHLSAGGILDVKLIDGFRPRLGDAFDLLDFGSIGGGFVLRLPALWSGLEFDASSLETTGRLTVVPEPGVGFVVGVGSVVGLFVRRRQG